MPPVYYVTYLTGLYRFKKVVAGKLPQKDACVKSLFRQFC